MALNPQPVPTTWTEGNCITYTPVSEIFTFNVECQWTRSNNPHRQLMWLNRYGHYDYYTFLFNRYEGYDIQRQQYRSWNTDWGSLEPGKTQYSRGLTDSEVYFNQTVIVHSGFQNMPTFQWLEELYTSNQVYEIQEDGGLYPVNILNTEFESKIKGNKTIYNLELQYVYSNSISLLGQ